jgi:hypothetical protein
MGKINWGRVLLGGIVAGLVFDALEFGANFLSISTRFMEEHGRLVHDYQPSGGQFAVFLLWGFVIGLVSIWCYAAVRPRLGPGPKTALIVAVMLWVLWALWMHLAMWAFGFFSLHLMLLYSGKLLVEQIITTMLGAWLYKEA